MRGDQEERRGGKIAERRIEDGEHKEGRGFQERRLAGEGEGGSMIRRSDA